MKNLVKSTGLDTYAILQNGELIATACKIKSSDSDKEKGRYRICIYGGVNHGKFDYVDFKNELETWAPQKAQGFIPFDGFYASVTSWFIDDEIDMLTEENSDMVYSIDLTYLAEEYVKAYINLSGIDSLGFSELIRPCEYNFTTDLILCTVSIEDIQKLYAQFIENGNCQSVIDARFKSRPGFASLYDDFCNEWNTKPIEKWDENELFILFPEFDYQEIWEDARCNGIFHNAIKIKEAI